MALLYFMFCEIARPYGHTELQFWQVKRIWLHYLQLSWNGGCLFARAATCHWQKNSWSEESYAQGGMLILA